MRLCQRIGCENSLEHLRADAQYCGPTCKREATRSRALTHEKTPAGGFWRAYTLIRRRRRRTIAHAAVLTVLLAAGCGGGHHAHHGLSRPTSTSSTVTVTESGTTSTSTIPSGLPPGACQGNNYAMQCKGSHPTGVGRPKPTAGLSVFGVDSYGAANSGINANFDCSYLSGSPGGKDWTGSGVRAWAGRGKHVCFVWETYANRAEYGYGAGQDDARRARDELASFGVPTSVPIRFAVDTDTSASAVIRYFEGVKSIIGGRTGVYGSYRIVTGLERAAITTPGTDWQTVAWSFGARSRACLYQSSINHLLDGESVDFDQATCANYGQYPYTPPAPRIVCFGKHAQGNATCRRVHAQIRAWQKAASSSSGAYRARRCTQLVALRNALNRRWDWFWNHTRRRLIVKGKQTSRLRALKATGRAVNGVRRTITGRSCLTFSGRAAYFQAKIKTTEAKYS